MSKAKGVLTYRRWMVLLSDRKIYLGQGRKLVKMGKIFEVKSKRDFAH